MKRKWYVVLGTDELGTYRERIWRAYTFAYDGDAYRVAADLNDMDPQPGIEFFVVEWVSDLPPGGESEPGLAVND